MLKDKIKELITKLESEFQTHIANANAAKGAIDAYKHLLTLPDETQDNTPEDLQA